MFFGDISLKNDVDGCNVQRMATITWPTDEEEGGNSAHEDEEKETGSTAVEEGRNKTAESRRPREEVILFWAKSSMIEQEEPGCMRGRHASHRTLD